MSTSRNNLVPFSRSPDYWIMRAGKRKNSTDYSQAGFLIRKAFLETKKTELAYQLADSFYQMGCYSAVRRVAIELLQQDNHSPYGFYWLGLSALKENDEDLAEQSLAIALKLGSDLPLADQVQDILSDYPWAEEPEYRRSSRATSIYYHALSFLQAGDLTQTENLLKRAVKKGKCPPAEALLGEILLYHRHYRSSERWLRLSIQKKPDQQSCWLLLAQVLDDEHKHEESEAAFRKAVSLNRTSRDWGMSAAVGCSIRQPETVKKALQEALYSQPESNDLLYIMAALEANTGNHMQATRILGSILARDPEDRDASAAICLLRFGMIPFIRIPDDGILIQDFLRQEHVHFRRNQPPYLRLAHGLTISLGGAVTYRETLHILSLLWPKLNPLQRRMSEFRSYWPNAFYRTICIHYKIKDLPEIAPLWSIQHCKKRVRRMSRYLNKALEDSTYGEL